MTVNIRLALVVVVTTLLLASCASDDDTPATDPPETSAPSPSPTAKHPAVGAYAYTSVVAESTLDASSPDEKPVEITVYLACGDVDCSTLLRRGDGVPTSLHSSTVRLVPEGDVLAGTRLRTGPCGPGHKGSYRESLEHTLERSADGVLAGEIRQSFKGCGYDGTATFTITAEPLPDEGLPFLPVDAASELGRAVTAYDLQAKAAFDSFAACAASAPAEGLDKESAACFAKMYAGYAPAVAQLQEDVAEQITDAPAGACGKRLKALDLPSLVQAMESAGETLGTVETGGAPKPALAEHHAAVELINAQNDLLVRSMGMCVPPVAQTSLGPGGVLVIDTNESLVPNDA